MDLGEIHRELKNLREDFTSHREVCGVRFGVLETDYRVRVATDGLKKEFEKEEKDWWKWAVRGITSVTALALLTVAWKVLTGQLRSLR